MINYGEFSTDLKLASFPDFQFAALDTGSFFLYAYLANASISHKFEPSSLIHEPKGDHVLVSFGSSFRFQFFDSAEYKEFCEFLNTEMVIGAH